MLQEGRRQAVRCIVRPVYTNRPHRVKTFLSPVLASWRDIAERSPVPLALTIGEGHEVLYANQAFRALRGAPPASLSGLAIYEGFPQSTRQRLIDLLNQVYRTGEPETILDLELPGIRQAPLFGTIAVSPVFDGPEQRRRHGLLVQIIDTTEHLRLQRQLEHQSEELRDVNQALIVSSLLVQTNAEEAEAVSGRLYELVQGLGVVVWEGDAKTFRYTFVSDAAEQLFGYPVSRWYREADLWSEMIDPSDRQFVMSRLRNCASEEVGGDLEYRIGTANGEVRWVRNLFHAVWPRGATLRLRGVLIDITEQKLAEVSLRQHLHTLEHTNLLKTELQRLLTDELRRPMPALVTSITHLRQAEHAEIGHRSPLTLVERQLKRQMRLLDNLRALEGITSTPPHRQRVPLNLADLVCQTCEEQRAEIESASLKFHAELPAEPLWIEGESAQLQQALKNVLHYGIRFTPPGERLTVALSGVADPQRALLTIQNSGSQISSERLARLLDRLTPGCHGNEWLQELGLDLILAKILVEAQSGEMQVATTPSGHGIEIDIRLPLCTTPTENLLTQDNMEAKAISLPRLRILVIEPDREAAETLQDLLELNGHEVELAFTSTAGLDTARRFYPEVILCGGGLVEPSGNKIAAEFRRHRATSSAHLIAMTHSGSDVRRQQACEAGFDLHLVKPIDLTEFAELLGPRISPTSGVRAAEVTELDPNHQAARAEQLAGIAATGVASALPAGSLPKTGKPA